MDMSLNACQGHWIFSSLKIPSYFFRIYVKFSRFFCNFSRIENTKKWQVNKLVNWSESKYADQTADRWVNRSSDWWESQQTRELIGSQVGWADLRVDTRVSMRILRPKMHRFDAYKSLVFTIFSDFFFLFFCFLERGSSLSLKFRRSIALCHHRLDDRTHRAPSCSRKVLDRTWTFLKALDLHFFNL